MSVSWWNEYFPSWLEAASTFSAFMAASVAAVYAVKVYGRETARDQRLEGQQRRAQAALVSGWIDEDDEAEGLYDDYGNLVRRKPSVLYLRNASQAPVTNIEATVTAYQTTIVTLGTDVLPPSDSPMKFALERHAPTELEWDGRGGVELAFRDSAGIRWERDLAGSLHEIGPQKGPRTGSVC